MKLSFELEVSDWVAFQRWYRGKRMPLFKVLVPLMITCCALLVVLNIVLIFSKGMSGISWISAILLLGLGYLLFLQSKSDRQLKEAGENLKERNPGAFGKLEMDFDDEGFTVTSSSNSKRLSWDEMDKNEENKNYCFLFSKKGLVYIIPKDKIKENPEEFYQILDKHLN